MYDLFMISFITDLLTDIITISDSLSECKMLLPNITVDPCECCLVKKAVQKCFWNFLSVLSFVSWKIWLQ